jgi:hypothetical protein
MNYYWHISERKQRAYLCTTPPGSFPAPDAPEQFAWQEWVGYVDTRGIVALRTGTWPSSTKVAYLGRMSQQARLDAAKTILLSLKQSEGTS